MKTTSMTWVVVLVLCGCSQSFKEGMQVVCDAPKQVKSNDPATQATSMATWISEHLSNKEVIALMGQVSMASPEERTKLFQDATKRAGITSCWVLDPPQVPAAAVPAAPRGGTAALREGLAARLEAEAMAQLDGGLAAPIINEALQEPVKPAAPAPAPKAKVTAPLKPAPAPQPVPGLTPKRPTGPLKR